MANKVLNVVLMCAGKSSRLGLNLPKVILPINGKSLLERTIKTLQHLKPKKISPITLAAKRMLLWILLFRLF